MIKLIFPNKRKVDSKKGGYAMKKVVYLIMVISMVFCNMEAFAAEEGEAIVKKDEVKILKRAEIERIGAEAAYEEFAGLRFGKYFSVGQRIEIYQEARPIDSYVMDAQYFQAGQAWDTPVQFRQQIVPQFTRAYGTQLTMDNPKDPSGQVAQIRYTLDYRDIYKQYYPKYSHFGTERWMQHEVFVIHATRIPGIDWYYTMNAGYRFSNIEVKGDAAAYENRHTYIASLAVVPHENMECYGQFEYFKSKRVKSPFIYSPDHYYWLGEIRFTSPDRTTSLIHGFSYSIDYYYPYKNQYEKYEVYSRVGRNFTKRLSATSQVKYVVGLRDNVGATALDLNPYKCRFYSLGTENRVSYKVWNDFYLQAGVDFVAGMNMSDFDNWGALLGVEYYKPGMLRANFGWNINHYYNIDDFLSTIGFRMYIFM